MKRKTLIALIISSCVVVVGCVGLVFWAFAATQVNVTSGLLVTYTPGLHVVCDVNATYQRTNDSSAIAFRQGNLSLKYNGTITDATLESSSSALQLNDSNTYVVFEFTFVNTNQEPNYDLTITLTDNGTVTNMTRKYYFGDLSSSNISAKRTTIKNSGISNSSLSSKKLVLGYQETGRIYMLLEITPGKAASYLADNTNKFAFTLTTAEHVEQVETTAYLAKDWLIRINDKTSLQNTTTSIIFTQDQSRIAGLANSISVGTNSATDTSAYVSSDTIYDVTAYWGSDKSTIVVYSPGTIYAPEDSSYLFCPDTSNHITLDNLLNLDLSNFDTSKVTNMQYMFLCGALTSLDVSNFDTSNVTNMEGMFADCASLTTLDLSNFNTSKVENMMSMFSLCQSLTNLEFGNIDTSKVINMIAMFAGCQSLTNLDLGNFNLISCTEIEGTSPFMEMFSGCSALARITLPYNLQSGYTISLPADSLYFNEAAGPYSTIGTATSGRTVACSTASRKVTLTKQ